MWAVPQPVQGPWLRLVIQHKGPADKVLLKVYTKALVVVCAGEGAGAAAAGPAPAALLLPGTLPKGLYYLQVRAQQGSQVSPAALLRFYYLGH